MKKIGLMLVVLFAAATSMFAQGARNIKINEVLTNNTSSVQDEFGQKRAWIELCNSSFSTYNVRGMYLTTDKSVLNEALSAPERQQMMQIIPNGDERTILAGRQHILFYCNSNPSQGALHVATNVVPGAQVWVALYDGNGVDLIDSVTVPALAADESYARKTDGSKAWEVRKSNVVTPDSPNTPSVNNKIARTKSEDPHGFAITILAMGTVFFCLTLLYIFFRLLGILMDHINTAKKIANKHPLKPVTKTVETTIDVLDTTATLLKDGPRTKGIDKKVYIAVISMALKQYQDDVHDVESGIISIKPRNTNWNNLIKE